MMTWVKGKDDGGVILVKLVISLIIFSLFAAEKLRKESI